MVKIEFGGIQLSDNQKRFIDAVEALEIHKSREFNKNRINEVSGVLLKVYILLYGDCDDKFDTVELDFYLFDEQDADRVHATLLGYKDYYNVEGIISGEHFKFKRDFFWSTDPETQKNGGLV